MNGHVAFLLIVTMARSFGGQNLHTMDREQLQGEQQIYEERFQVTKSKLAFPSVDVIACSSSTTLCFLSTGSNPTSAVAQAAKSRDWNFFLFLFVRSRWAVDRIDSVRKGSAFFPFFYRSLIVHGLQKGSASAKTKIKVQKISEKTAWRIFDCVPTFYSASQLLIESVE